MDRTEDLEAKGVSDFSSSCDRPMFIWGVKELIRLGGTFCDISGFWLWWQETLCHLNNSFVLRSHRFRKFNRTLSSSYWVERIYWFKIHVALLIDLSPNLQNAETFGNRVHKWARPKTLLHIWPLVTKTAIMDLPLLPVLHFTLAFHLTGMWLDSTVQYSSDLGAFLSFSLCVGSNSGLAPFLACYARSYIAYFSTRPSSDDKQLL
jgi:hypothetical protein